MRTGTNIPAYVDPIKLARNLLHPIKDLTKPQLKHRYIFSNRVSENNLNDSALNVAPEFMSLLAGLPVASGTTSSTGSSQRPGSQDAQGFDTFSQILSSNLDALIELSPQASSFSPEPAALPGLPLRNVLLAHTSVDASSSTTIDVGQWLVDGELPGKVLPGPGSSRPLATGESTGEIGNAKVPAPESDAVHTLGNQFALTVPAAPIKSSEPPPYDDVNALSLTRDASFSGLNSELLQSVRKIPDGSAQAGTAHTDQRLAVSTGTYLAHGSQAANQPADQPVNRPAQPNPLDADQLLSELYAAGLDTGTLDNKLSQPSPEQSTSQSPSPSPTAFAAISSPLLNAAGLPASAAVTLTDRASAAQQIAEHVTQFVRQGEEFAEISLNPPHLGKIRVQITVANEQASVILTTLVPDIRDVLESSIPRLSNLLANAGLSLADARVMQDAQQQQNSGNSSANSPDPQTAVDERELEHISTFTRIRETNLLDLYA